MTAPTVVARWSTWAPQLRSVLRIFAAFTFMQFGTAKLFAFPGAIMPGGGTAPVVSLVGLASILESFGGALLLVGLFTRPVAFLLAGEMAVAYFIGHGSHGFWTVLNQGTPAVIYCFVWLYLSAAAPASPARSSTVTVTNERSAPSARIAARSGAIASRAGAPAVFTSWVAVTCPPRRATARSVPGAYGTRHIRWRTSPSFRFTPNEPPFRNSSSSSALV